MARPDHSNTRRMQGATNQRLRRNTNYYSSEERALEAGLFASATAAARKEGRVNTPGQRPYVNRNNQGGLAQNRGGANAAPATSRRPVMRQPSNTGRRTYSTRAR
jgi:hypothetical protein